MTFRNYLTGTIFFVVMLFGPIDHESEYGMVLRFSQVILIPSIIWLLLSWLWVKYEISKKTETLLERILSIVISLTLIVFALIEVIYPNPWYDGIVRRNWGNVFLLMIFAGFFLNIAFTKGKNKNIN
jgi:hypothetical protein